MSQQAQTPDGPSATADMLPDPMAAGIPPPEVGVREEWLARHEEPVIEPDLPIIDPHHHLWYRTTERYREADLLRDLQDGHDVRATVFVQCRAMYRPDGPAELRPVGETAWVEGIARGLDPASPRIASAIVAMADLMLGEAVGPVLDAHVAAAPTRLRGVRNMTTFHADIPSNFGSIPARRLLDPRFQAGFALLAPRGLSYDVWAYHTQLDDVLSLARTFPDTAIVLDHMGGPLGIGPFKDRHAEVFSDWRDGMRALASCANVAVKLGGAGMFLFGHEFHTRDEPPDSATLAAAMRPHVETCIALFGAGRCMFESNFPVDKGMFSYRTFWNACKRLTAGASEDERASLFRDTASRVYRIASD